MVDTLTGWDREANIILCPTNEYYDLESNV